MIFSLPLIVAALLRLDYIASFGSTWWFIVEAACPAMLVTGSVTTHPIGPTLIRVRLPKLSTLHEVTMYQLGLFD